MGRSVSYPTDCATVCFRDVSDFGRIYDCDTDEYLDEYDEYQAQIDWDDLVDWIRATAKHAWPSLEVSNTWLGREDRAILENNFCHIGVSQYGCIASIWLKSKGNELCQSWYAEDIGTANLADAWCSRISPKFHSLFGQYTKIATASNGESFYQKSA